MTDTNPANLVAKSSKLDEEKIETLFLPVANTKSMQTSTAKSAVVLQSWWRMVSAKNTYREQLQPVHKVTFLVTLLIRILVISYLVGILQQVLNLINGDLTVEPTGPAKSLEALERSVLRELMMKDSAGWAIVATSSVLLLAYVAAQAYSIYSLVPRTIRHETKVNKKDGKYGRLEQILICVKKSKIYKFYLMYRYPFIPIGLQIFETTSQMLAFTEYAIGVTAREPLLVWALLLSLDNIITPWIVFHGEDKIGSSTKWDRVLPGLSLVFSLSYSFVVPLLMIATWKSILGNVDEHRFNDSTTTGPFQYSEYAQNYLIGAGDSGISFGFNAAEGLYRVVGEEVYMSNTLRLLAAYFPLLNVLLTLRNMENRDENSTAKFVVRTRLRALALSLLPRVDVVHPEKQPQLRSIAAKPAFGFRSATVADGGRSSVANRDQHLKNPKAQTRKCRRDTFKRVMQIMGLIIPIIMTSLSLIFITIVFYGAFRPVCEGSMWDVCYARTFHVFDFKTECPCVVYLASSKNEKPWSCNSDRDCAEYEWCASNFNYLRTLECIPSICPNNTEMSCSTEQHVNRDCEERRSRRPEIMDECRKITDPSNWTAEFNILEKYYPSCDKHDDCNPGYYCRTGGFSPLQPRPAKFAQERLFEMLTDIDAENRAMACNGNQEGRYQSPTGLNRCNKCEHCADLNDCPDSHRCDFKNYTEPDLPTDLRTIWEAMENNTKNSLVIFAIAGRPIDGLVDLRNISKFARLHTFVISDVQQVNETVRKFGPCPTANHVLKFRDAYSESLVPKCSLSYLSNKTEEEHQEQTTCDTVAKATGDAGSKNKNKGRKLGSKKMGGSGGSKKMGGSGGSKEMEGSGDSGSKTKGKRGDSGSKEKKRGGDLGSTNITQGGRLGSTNITQGDRLGSTNKTSPGKSPGKSPPIVTLTLPVPLNGCTYNGHPKCASQLQVFIVNRFNVDIKFSTEGVCEKNLPPGRATHDPKLQVAIFTMLSHSTLRKFPDDVICDDRKSLRVFKANYIGCKCTALEKPIAVGSKSKLVHIPHSLGECSNLEVLNLDYNNLPSIPSWLGQLSKLQYLSIEAATQGGESDNENAWTAGSKYVAVDFPSQSHLPELRFANLRRNNFGGSAKVPVDMFSSMSKLTRLDISQTNLKTLPKSIGSLRALQSLDASDNPSLKELPDSISELKNLKTLLLANTDITNFSRSFGSLKNITTLDLSSMKLTALPNSLCSLHNLVALGLQGNDLRDIPRCFANLTKLADHDKLRVSDLFADCSNIRLKHNASHPGYQRLRGLLKHTWRKRCACSADKSTSCKCAVCTCGNQGPDCSEWMKGVHSPCPVICKSKEEEHICLENSGLL